MNPFHENTSLSLETIPKRSKKTTDIQYVQKGWGHEIIFANHPSYCGKILSFQKDKRFSMHYHVNKRETWYVTQGSFILLWIEPSSGEIYQETLQKGDVITNERGEAHQLIALEDSEIFEVSTQHFDEDSFRIWKGH